MRFGVAHHRTRHGALLDADAQAQAVVRHNISKGITHDSLVVKTGGHLGLSHRNRQDAPPKNEKGRPLKDNKVWFHGLLITVKNCFVYALDELFAKMNYMLQGFMA